MSVNSQSTPYVCVDFNNIDDNGNVIAPNYTRQEPTDRALMIGMKVTAFSPDGDSCLAEVVESYDTSARLRIDVQSWQEETDIPASGFCSHHQHPEFKENADCKICYPAIYFSFLKKE